MALSRKKRSKSSSKTSSKKRFNIDSSTGLYGAAALLLIIGQSLVFRGSSALGFLISFLGLIPATLAYFELKISDLDWRSLLAAQGLSSKHSASKGPKSQKKKLKEEPREKSPTPMGILRTVLILAAFGLGIKGQMMLSNIGYLPRIGLIYYCAGVILFLFALLPWTRERLQQAPLSPRWEWVVFGAIFLLAAFLRIYKLDTIPAGVFFDTAFQGYEALKVLHEGARPWVIDVSVIFPTTPVPIYTETLWFLFFKNNQFNIYFFYWFFSLATLPFIYWTFRQLAGPRVALLSFYILAVMRWHITFSRDGFPTAMLPFFMFGTLSLLLYGLRTRKKWTFCVAGVLCAGGLYTYQIYIVFPLFLFVCGLYECCTNWKAIKANAKMLAVFALIFFALGWPIVTPLFKGQLQTRASQLSIFNVVKKENSLRPLIVNLETTALMFNRKGDPNARHNYSDHRQLDNVTGFLLVFGFFYALARLWRRKYFYAVSGLIIMAIPSLITIDPAHASRMYGMTPFIALASASILAALWGRFRMLWGRKGEVIFLVLLALPLFRMGTENFREYFVEQANFYASWREYSTVETAIGKRCAQYGDQYDCFITPTDDGHYTIMYFAYFQREHLFRLDVPSCLSKIPAPGRGLYFAIQQDRTGILELLKDMYPGGEAELVNDPEGTPYVYFYKVPPEQVDQIRGLKAEISSDPSIKRIPAFPLGLPEGPYRAKLTGNIYIDQTGSYQFYPFKSGGKFSWSIAGKPVPPGAKIDLIKGFHKIMVDLTVPKGTVQLSVNYKLNGGKLQNLTSDMFNSVPCNHGLKGSYYANKNAAKPMNVQWDPVLNFMNGNDFSTLIQGPMTFHWTGTIQAPKTGNYKFFARTNGSTKVEIDHREAHDQIHLMAGVHKIDVTYQILQDWNGIFNLYWVTPGSKKSEILPSRLMGEIP